MKTEEVKAYSSPAWAASPHDLIDLFAQGSPASPYASPNTRKRKRRLEDDVAPEACGSPIKKRAIEDLLTGDSDANESQDPVLEAELLSSENVDSTNKEEGQEKKKKSRMKAFSSKLMGSRGGKRVTIAAVPTRSVTATVLSNLTSGSSSSSSSGSKRRTRAKSSQAKPVAVPVPQQLPERDDTHSMTLRRRKSSLLHLDDDQAQKLKEVALSSPAHSLARNRSTSLSGLFSHVKTTGSELLNKAPSSTNMATVFGTPARRMMRSRMSITHQQQQQQHQQQQPGSTSAASRSSRSSRPPKPALLRSTSLAVMPTTELTGVARLNAFGTPRPGPSRPTARPKRSRAKINSKSLRTSKKQIRADVKQLFKRESSNEAPVPGAPATVVTEAQLKAKYFGRDLQEVMEEQQKVAGLENIKVPFVVHFSASAIKERYLEEEGLFRISPSHADIQELERMVESSEDGGQEKLHALDKNSGMMEKPHLFCSTIKKYLRDLPDPVLCTKMTEQWMDLARMVTAEKLSGEEKSTEEMKRLVAALPEHNQNLLAEVMDLALKVSEHSGKNLMTSENLSKVFGPNLLNDAPPNEYPALFDLVNHMIVNCESVFGAKLETESTELPTEDVEMASEEKDFLSE